MAVAALALASCAAAANPGSLRTAADVLRARQSATVKAEQTALLDLYALESSLVRARGNLAALRARLAGLKAEEAAARNRLRIAQQAVKRSETSLAQELRVLYERGDPNALAVLLGSENLDAAITELDAIDRSALDHRRIIDQTLHARKVARALATTLVARQKALRAVEKDLASSVARLQQTRDVRAAYVGRLRTERHLAAVKIASLEAAAAAAERKSRELAEARARAAAAAAAAAAAKANAARPGTATTAATTTAVASPSGSTRPAPAITVASAENPNGATLPANGASATPGSGDRTLVVTVTAYTLRGHTATGLPTSWGIVAVDPAVIPLGTKMTIPGYGEAIAADTGPGVRGAAIDVWVPDGNAAVAFGRRTVTIVLH